MFKQQAQQAVLVVQLEGRVRLPVVLEQARERR
jgi:hypothetical protein